MTEHDDDDVTTPGRAVPVLGVVVPHDRFPPETLRAVIEEFVSREGTEYGQTDVPLETKVTQVTRQLERGEVSVLFDPVSESVNLVPTRSLPPDLRDASE